MREIILGETIEVPFAANNDQGSGDDGSTPTFDVREEGVAGTVAPVFSGTPTLLTDAGYPAGCYVCSIPATVANGFAWNKTYHVFASLTVATAKTPTGSIGSFEITPAAAAKKTGAQGVVSTAVIAPTTTVISCTGISTAQADVYKGLWLAIFSSGSALFKAKTRITASALNTGEQRFTVEGFPIAPSVGDEVVVY